MNRNCMLEISFKIRCSLGNTKKDKFLTGNTRILLLHTVRICFYIPKHNEFSTKTSHGYTNHICIFPIFLNSKITNYKFSKKRAHWCSPVEDKAESTSRRNRQLLPWSAGSTWYLQRRIESPQDQEFKISPFVTTCNLRKQSQDGIGSDSLNGESVTVHLELFLHMPITDASKWHQPWLLRTYAYRVSTYYMVFDFLLIQNATAKVGIWN
jgi:hypothetical protein